MSEIDLVCERLHRRSLDAALRMARQIHEKSASLWVVLFEHAENAEAFVEARFRLKMGLDYPVSQLSLIHI